MDIWFTSDLHLSHNKSFLYEPRGFKTVEEMNEAIIERWNKVVKPDDIVYHLGDVFLNNDKVGIECVKRLNGTIFMIWGNHDTNNRKDILARECNNFFGGWYAYQTKYNKLTLYLSHYPTLTANYDEKHFSQHIINLHGHTHQQANFMYPNNPFIYHVGVDSHNCTPIHIDEVLTDIRQRYKDLQTLGIPIQELYSYPMIDK